MQTDFQAIMVRMPFSANAPGPNVMAIIDYNISYMNGINIAHVIVKEI